MLSLLLLFASDAPPLTALVDQVDALCLDPELTQCWQTTSPEGAEGDRLAVREERGGALSLHVDAGTVRLSPWVADSAVHPVVTEATVLPLGGQAEMRLEAGYPWDSAAPLALSALTLQAPTADKVPVGKSYQAMALAPYPVSEAEKAHMRTLTGPLVQPIPAGSTLHGAPEGPALARFEKDAQVEVLERQGDWALVALYGPHHSLRFWAHKLPKHRVPPAIGYCAGARGWGVTSPPLRVMLPADAPLSLDPSGPALAYTVEATSHDVSVDAAGTVRIYVQTPWGAMPLYPDPSMVRFEELEAFRAWIAEGPLYAKAQDGSCTNATLDLAEGHFPTGELRIEQAPTQPGGVCHRSVSLSWRGGGMLTLSGPGGICEYPDGSGEGWGMGEMWVDSFSTQAGGWVRLGDEWLHHDADACAKTAPPAPSDAPPPGLTPG